MDFLFLIELGVGCPASFLNNLEYQNRYQTAFRKWHQNLYSRKDHGQRYEANLYTILIKTPECILTVSSDKPHKRIRNGKIIWNQKELTDDLLNPHIAPDDAYQQILQNTIIELAADNQKHGIRMFFYFDLNDLTTFVKIYNIINQQFYLDIEPEEHILLQQSPSLINAGSYDFLPATVGEWDENSIL